MNPAVRAKIEAMANAVMAGATMPPSRGVVNPLDLQINKNFPNANKQAREVLFFILLMTIYEKLKNSKDSRSANVDLPWYMDETRRVTLISNVMKMHADNISNSINNLR